MTFLLLNEVMNAFRALENESLLSSHSAPARWDPFRCPLDSIQPWQFRLLAAVMLVVTSLSLAENLAVILVTFKFKQLRQPVNYVIVNLSVADFLVSLTGGTISFLANLKGYFFMGYWACILEGFAVTFFGKLDFACSFMFFSFDFLQCILLQLPKSLTLHAFEFTGISPCYIYSVVESEKCISLSLSYKWPVLCVLIIEYVP